MKLSKVILACNDNRDYCDFWPLVAKFWRRLEVEPVLFYVGEDRSLIDTSFGEVIFCKSLNINTAFHAQSIRLLAPTLFPNDTCIVSDMDTLPLSYKYFHENIAECQDDAFVYYNIDPIVEDDQLYMTFSAAKGETWGSVFNVHDWDDINTKLMSWWNPMFYATPAQRNRCRLFRLLKLKNTWYTDQRKLKECIDAWEEKEERFVMLKNHSKAHCSLDRDEIATEIRKGIIKDEDLLKYTCFHMPKPYSKNKDYINYIDNVFNTVDIEHL